MSRPQATPRSAPGRTSLVLVAWVAVCGFGLGIVGRYENGPGAPLAERTGWPEGVALELDRERPTLVLFAHPRCPCTRATLRELGRVAAHGGERLRLHVVFLVDGEDPDGWTDTDLWTLARRVPGVEVHADRDGGTTRRFGARTSGQVIVFDPAGTILFDGGITRSRGHEGDNAGAAAVEAIAAGEHHDRPTTPVFGCPLLPDDSEPAEAEG